MTMKSASEPLSPPRTSLHNLGVKKVNLSISYDSENRSIKRTVSISANVSAEEAAQVDHLTKLNATFSADLHVEGYQPKLTDQTPEEGREETVDDIVKAALAASAPGGDGKQPVEAVPSSGKRKRKREKVGTATE